MRKPSPKLTAVFLLAAVTAMAVNLRAPLVALGPVVGFIQDELHVSGTFMGVVAALPVLAFAVCSPLAAGLARRFGMENVLIASIVWMMIGAAVRSAYPSAVLLAVGTIVLSAAIAMQNVLLPALAKRNMPARVGLVIGLLSSGMALSAAVAAAVSVPLAQWQNWRWSLGVWLLTGAAALAVWLAVRPHLRVDAPNAAQHFSDGINVWRSPAAWCISLFMGVQSLIFYAAANFLPSVLLEKGISPIAAGGYSSLWQISSLIGILFISGVFGRSRRKQPVILMVALMLLAGVAGVWLGSTDLMWLWAACCGIGATGLFSSALILFAERTDSPQQAASLSGMAQTVGYFLAALGPLGMGVVHDALGSWSASMGVLTALAAAECLLAWFAANPKTLAQMRESAADKTPLS